MASIGAVNTLLLLGALLVLAGILSSLVATRFGAPLLLVFLVLGMLAGEDGPGGIAFDDYRLTYLVGSFALAVILFDGGLRTRLSAFRGALAPSLLLATVGVLVTAALTGAFAIYVLGGLSWIEGLLLGAIVASTDAAAVFFLLRAGGLQLKHRVGAVLEIESGTNDPVAVFLTVILTELILAGADGPTWEVLAALGQQAVLGGALGVAGGLAASWLLNRVELPSGLHPPFVVASAVLIYALAAVAEGSGFLAVYVAGLVLGNRPVRAYPAIVSFHDAATWLAQIVMFLVLGLLVTPSRLVGTLVPALAIAAFLIVIGRPLAVWLCLSPFGFSVRERLFVSWVGLRGAVSIFLAAIPTLSGVPHALAFFDVAFVVVLVSLLLQGWTLTLAARRLGLALPRTALPVSRVELDLPGQLTYELVGYPIAEDSAVLDRGAVPRWARPVLVVRDEAILDPAQAGPLAVGDYAYFLVAPDQVHRLDRLFAASTEGGADRARFGEFAINGDAPLPALADLYGLEIPEADRDLTVAALFARRFEDDPEIGDRLPLGEAVLVVRATEGDRVTRAGLQLDDLAGSIVEAALLEPGRLAAALRPWRRLSWPWRGRGSA